MPDIGLRRYPHPGKFEGGLLIDEAAYQFTMNGADEEVGESDSFGWFGLLKTKMPGDFVPDIEAMMKEVDPDNLPLTDTERAFLKRVVGCVVYENSQGFIDVTWYTNKRALETAWRGINKEYEAFDAQAEGADVDDV